VVTMAESGERIIPGSRRPDGTLRKDIRVRPGYVPIEEQEVYVSRGAKVLNTTRLSEYRHMSAYSCAPPTISGWRLNACPALPPERPAPTTGSEIGPFAQFRDTSKTHIPGLNPAALAAAKAANAASLKSKAAKKNDKRKEKRQAEKAAGPAPSTGGALSVQFSL